MAEVKRAARGASFSLSSSKKPQSFSNNGVSSSSTSFKHIYDDVFAASSSPKVQSSSTSFMEDDYAEVFGSSKSSNGAWNISYSSIPLLELPKEKGFGLGSRGGGERVDYGGVFGVGVDNSDGFGLPDGEELFDQLKKKPKTSRGQGQTTEATRPTTPEISGQSYDVQSPTNRFCQSFDNMEHFEPGNKVVVNATRGPRKEAHVRAYSLHDVSATQKTLSSQTPVIKDDTLDTNSKDEKTQGNHVRHTSLDLAVNKQNTNSDTGLQKVSGMRESYSVVTSHGTCQSSNTATNGFCQSLDNTKHSEYKINELNIKSTRGETHSVDLHPVQEPNSSLQPEAKPESSWSNELGPNQKILSSITSVLSEETQTGVGVKHSSNTGSDLGANRQKSQNDQCDPVFQNACGLSESSSIDTSQETCQTSFTAGPSKVVKDDVQIAIGCDEVKKKGRRSRMTSIDLGDYKPSGGERGDGPKRKPRFGGSYSFDASHDPCAGHVKAQPSMMYPSSSLPQFFPVESRYKVSENSNCKSSQKNPYRGVGGSPPPLAEELDVTSVAAVSAATLQRAIEEAELRIRLAKAFLERECQGSTKLRFKDTLKVKTSKENGLDNEINTFKQTAMHECSPPIDSDMRPCSPLERKSVVENPQAPVVFEDQAPEVFEDQNNSVSDGELSEGIGAKASNLIGGDDKLEVEWEAAKHLNQLISGVKNRLASFMSWQTETEIEKKEGMRETEDIMKPQQRPEEVEHVVQDHEASKKNRTSGNQSTTTSAGKALCRQNKIGFASRALEPEENESIRSFNVAQDKAGTTVDFIPDTTDPSSEEFQFFAFRNQILCDPPDPEVEEKGPQRSRVFEIENRQEQLTSEVKYEHIPLQDEELQELDEKCATHDMEEPCSLAGHNEMELSHEEDRQVLISARGNICSVNEENVDMVEAHYSIAGNEKKELTHEEGGQDDTSRKTHTGSFTEENNEIVEESYSLAEHNEKELTHEDDGQGVKYRKIDLGSSNEESNEIAQELCKQDRHERNDAFPEESNDKSLKDEFNEKAVDNFHVCENTTERSGNDGECEVLKEAKNQHENIEFMEEFNLVGEALKNIAATDAVFKCQENGRGQGETNHIEEVSGQAYGREEIKIIHSETDHIEETAEKVTLQASCIASAEEGCKQNENVIISKAEACSFVESSSKAEQAVYTDEEIERMMEIANTSSDPEMDIENPVLAQKASEAIAEGPPVSAQKASELIAEEPMLSSISIESNMELGQTGIQEGLNGTIGTLSHESFVSCSSESDTSSVQMDVDVKVVESEYQDNLDYLPDSGEELHEGEFDTSSDQDVERSGVEAGHRRRRWFDNSGCVGDADRPSILEGNHIDLEIDQEVLDESELAGSVEIHAGKLDCSVAEATTARDADTSSSQDGSRINVETTPTRRKWFVKRGEEGVPEPVSLFEGIEVNLVVPLENVNELVMPNISGHCLDKLNTKSVESLNAVKSDVTINGEKSKQNAEAVPRRRRWFEGGERAGPGQQVRINEDVGIAMEIDHESKAKGDGEKHVKLDSMPISPDTDGVNKKVETVKEHRSDRDDLNRREKERGKEKIAVERAIREARERAFAEAKERARRDAAERPNVEVRQRVAAGVQEKMGKASSEACSSTDKASVEAKLKAERAAVERATSEARERALQKALSEKASHRSREQAGRYSSEKSSSLETKYQSSRCSDSSNNSEKLDGADVESAQRRKARLERQKRTMERATNALEEKNKRDLLAQKEQTAKNMLADSLDAEVKRWSTGKEGNLRALLSTLQYILGPESGWQPVSLTDLVAATAVRKSYKKATLCVHPDKLQQRGASIQQKYICEKVFDLLKEAWSKFNPDER
ncbi:hypothetical protein SOVF_073660 [Spinacia oleracea]|nr:hypothetical protein SOVF_073660 [Spinacia oleracea]